jgi:uncharacterized protein (TIRG00374 family)
MSQHSRHRRALIAAAKLLFAAAILAYLFYSLRDDRVFGRFIHEPKNWGHLAAAQALILLAISLNYIRWYVLVRALGLNFRLADSFRLGSLGTLLSQVWFGSVGGDMFKAAFIAREQRGKRTEAVASVVIDRVVGLYAMLLVASVGRIVAGGFTPSSRELATLSNLVGVLAIIGTIGVGLLMVPAITGPRVAGWLAGVPMIGHTLVRLLGAAAAYRHERRYLFAAIFIAACTHTTLVLAIWSVGLGLPVNAPALPTTFLVGPMSLCAGAIPLTPGGLGTFEAAMDKLYELVGAAPGDGLLVALTYRVMTYVMAAAGAVFYLRSRKTINQTMHEAEDLEMRLEEELGAAAQTAATSTEAAG